ncbi:MAG: hypothetical protein ACPGOV_13470 [Magnetovibrionaceae bacterium]
MEGVFSESVQNAKTILELWPRVIACLQTAEGSGGEKFNQEAAVPGTQEELWWFDERTLATANLILSLDGREIDAGAPIPTRYVEELENSSKAVLETIRQLVSFADQVDAKGIATLNPGNWVVAIQQTNANINVASHLQNLKNHLEELLVRYYQVAQIVGANSFDAFTEAVREFSEQAEKVRKAADAIEKAKSDVDSHAAQTKQLREDAATNSEDVANTLSTAQETLTKIIEVNQSSDAELDKVTDISANAVNLKAQVDEYQGHFKSFQQTLSEKNEAFKTWTTDVEALYSGLNEKEEKIGQTIERADQMLAVSTNAGLAGTFKENLDDLDSKLVKTQREFYIAILFVFLSALPLSAYVITVTVLAVNPDLFPTLQDGEEPGFWLNLMNAVKADGLTLSATLALLLIMIPSLWLSKFSASKYHQLFQLREHYQYKYSIAMSVEGFKLQAAGYENVLAAETFNRLLFNPGDRLDGKGSLDEHPSPLMNWAMNKFGFNAKGENN